MERKLASVQEIKNITLIENADALEVAHVLGWKVVIRKDDNYRIGQKIVYFEIDSFLPLKDEFEFLRKSSYKNSPILGEGFKLKTIRLRGQISQGLIMPLQVFFNEDAIADMEIGLDLTDTLGVKKWEEPEQATLGGDAKGRRPGWIEHSSEERIQSSPELLNEFSGLDYYITTKYDGASHFIAIDENDEFHFGSHNLELKPIEKGGSFYNFILDNKLNEKLLSIKNRLEAKRIYIIGEWCGQGIQKNKLQLQKGIWYPFTINIDGERLGLYDMQTIVNELGIKMVEIEEIGTDLPSVYKSIDELLVRAGENRKHVYPGQCEGIVIRPVRPVFSEILGKDLSMKIINNNYLLKE